MTFTLTSRFLAMAILLTSAYSAPITRREDLELEARAATSCYPMSLDQAKKMPGWSKLEQWAKDNYGEGGVNILTNPEEYPDRPAQACISLKPAPIEWAQQPSCSESEDNLGGTVTGTTQTNTLEQTTGSKRSAGWTVTKSSEIATNVEFNIGVEFEKVFSAGMSTSVTSTVKNERQQTFSTETSNEVKKGVSFENANGDKCNVMLKTKTCSATGRGRAPVVATGFVWFNYDDKRTAKNDPNGGEHYKYSANIDSILSEAERTSFLEFEGPVNYQSQSTYQTACVPINGKTAKAKAAVKRADSKAKPGANPLESKAKGDPKKPDAQKAEAKGVPKPNAAAKALPKTGKPAAPKSGAPKLSAPKPPAVKPAPLAAKAPGAKRR